MHACGFLLLLEIKEGFQYHQQLMQLLIAFFQVSLHQSHPAAWHLQPLLLPRGRSWTGHTHLRSPPQFSRKPSDARSRGEPAGRPRRCEAGRAGKKERSRTTSEEDDRPLLCPSLSSLYCLSDRPPSQYPALLEGEQRTLPPPHQFKPPLSYCTPTRMSA